MSGLALFVGLLAGGGLIGSLVGWQLHAWWAATDAEVKRQIDRMARADWQRDILRESAAQNLPNVWEATR